MSSDASSMYQLLPGYIRLADQKNGAALEQFLGIVNEQREALALDLARMYDGWFIETRDEWLVPLSCGARRRDRSRRVAAP